jgi:vitamin B12 transporter
MKFIQKGLFVFAIVFGLLQALVCVDFAQEAVGPVELGPVVVTATKTEVPLNEVAGSVTVITEDEIQAKKAKTVLEVLRDVPGLDVVQTGGPGGATSVFIRGGNSSHTLVLVDGMRVNSPMTGGFDFADLTVDNIERIEIVRGPQSALYGSEAIGGVINIITKHGKGAPSVSLSAEAGSYRTFRESVGVTGAMPSLDYSLAVARFDTAGFSSADRRNGNTEADGNGNTTLSSRLGWNAGAIGKLELTARYMTARTDLDGCCPPADDPNYVQDHRVLLLSGRYSRTLTSWWSQELRLGFNRDELTGHDPDPADLFNNYNIAAQNRQLDWLHHFSIGTTDLLTIGYEHEGQAGRGKDAFDKTISNSAVYVQNQHQVTDLFSQVVGVRADYNSRFGDVITYKAEAAYRVPLTGTKLRAAYGTGFHGPTLNDLFFPGYGNPDLKPETSETIEVGGEQILFSNAVSFRGTYFHTSFDNLIVFDSTTFLPENIGKAMAKGAELELDLSPVKAVTLKTNYTYTTTLNEENSQELPRRPRQKANVGLSVLPVPSVKLLLDFRYVGKRFDDTANTQPIGAYTIVNASGSFDLTSKVQLFARAENLFNRKYEEILGYGTAGRSAYGGVKATF